MNFHIKFATKFLIFPLSLSLYFPLILLCSHADDLKSGNACKCCVPYLCDDMVCIYAVRINVFFFLWLSLWEINLMYSCVHAHVHNCSITLNVFSICQCAYYMYTLDAGAYITALLKCRNIVCTTHMDMDTWIVCHRSFRIIHADLLRFN